MYTKFDDYDEVVKSNDRSDKKKKYFKSFKHGGKLLHSIDQPKYDYSPFVSTYTKEYNNNKKKLIPI